MKTEKKVTSLDIVYAHYFSNQYGVGNMAELAVVIGLDETNLEIWERNENGTFQSKHIPEIDINNPNFMNKEGSDELKSTMTKDQNVYATEQVDNGGSQPMDSADLDLLENKRGLHSEIDIRDKTKKLRFFQYFREIDYFVGYMTQITTSDTNTVHFVAFNPFRTKNKVLVFPNAFTEKVKNNQRKYNFRVWLDRIDTGTYCIGFNSPNGCFIMKFDNIHGTVEKVMDIDIKSNPNVSGQMVGKENIHVYIPYQNKLNIWDYENNESVYTIELEYKVIGLFKSIDGLFVGAVDSSFFYVIDVTKMLIIQKHDLTNRKQQTKMMMLVMQFFPQFKEYQLPEFSQDVTVVKIIDNSQITGLRYMPVDHLSKCFSEKDNKKSLLAFGDFYSETLATMGGFDYIFGPLNPYIFAIFYSEEQILQTLLEKNNYPKHIINFTTPIEYCFLKKENDCLRILCNLLQDKTQDIYFTKNEFKELLVSEFEFCDKLLIKVPLRIPLKKINFLEHMDTPRKMRFNISLNQYLIDNNKAQYEAEHNPTKEDKLKAKDRLDIKFCPFKYNFTIGSNESMDFLNHYSDSESNEFVESDWKTIIKEKWVSLKFLYAFNAIVFWIYMAFCTWSIIFNLKLDEDGKIIGENITAIRTMASVFNCIILFLEILQMIAYCTYKPSLYFGDFWNYIDIVALVLAFVFFLKLHETATEGGAQFVALILMLLIYYRGFSYFRYFESFTSMIGIINTIVGESLSFFGVLFYTYFVIFFLLFRVDPGDGFINKMRDAYIFTFFGGVEQDHFEAKYIFFPLVMGTMIVTIILLNVLIAFMSNVYNKMEALQNSLSLKEKASMLLDLEVYISLFKKIGDRCKLKKKSIEETEQYYLDQEKLIFFLIKIEGVTKTEGVDNAYTKMKNLEKNIEVLEQSINQIGTRNDKEFTSLKKRIKGINKFIGFEKNDLSHFDAKMQGILMMLFEDFSEGITDNVVNTIEREFNIERLTKKHKKPKHSLINFN